MLFLACALVDVLFACAPKMGFADDFRLPSTSDVVATAHCYKQLGNAVCPPVIRAVGVEIVGALRKAMGISDA